MIVPRIAALALLVGLGFALAQVAQAVYVVAVEGYASWLAVVGFLAPAGILAAASAVLVLRRRPLGARLAAPLLAVALAVAVVTAIGAPPVGAFLRDWQEARLARGVEVPEYRRSQGWTAEDYVERQASDFRLQGALGAAGAAVLYALVLRLRPVRRAGSATPSARTGTRAPSP